MLALIKDGAIDQVIAEDARFSHDGAAWMAPATDGWELDGLRLVTILEADRAPDGKVAIGSDAGMVNGQLKFVNMLEEAPPPPRFSTRSSRVALSTPTRW